MVSNDEEAVRLPRLLLKHLLVLQLLLGYVQLLVANPFLVELEEVFLLALNCVPGASGEQMGPL